MSKFVRVWTRRMCGKSGVLDINGVEICAGDKVKMTINIMHSRTLIVEESIVFYRGAFRFADERKAFQSCIGDISHNVTLEVISSNKL